MFPSSNLPIAMTRHELAKMMDHSLLKPFLSEEEITAGCKEAVELDTASVCVRPTDVDVARAILEGSDVKLSTVIGFPHGSNSTAIKVAEAREALQKACVELDMVVNIGAVKSGNFGFVKADIAAVLEACREFNAKLKVIFENCYLVDDEKVRLCEICSEIMVDWVKTSTGFGTGGATDEDLILMRKHSHPDVQLKAAGGVRSLDRAIRVRELQCTRFGCTASRAILEEFDAQS